MILRLKWRSFATKKLPPRGLIHILVTFIEPNDSKQRYENVLHEISLDKNDLNDLYAAVNELDDLIQNETGSNGTSEQ